MTLLAEFVADEAETAALGRALAGLLTAGDTVLLEGGVGAGKSHLARALIRARQRDFDAEVPSPTFTLVQTYADAFTGTEIWHADLYRLSDPDELAELGLDEAMEHAICLIEWPERLDPPPARALRIVIEPSGASEDLRKISLIGNRSVWSSVARATAFAALTERSGWGEAYMLPLAGDASARRYFRLFAADGSTAVLMDAPPGSLGSYLSMTGWLRDRGFHAPEILAAAPDDGLLLVEDMGDDLLARRLEIEPELAADAYHRVTSLLLGLHGHAPPDFIRPLDGPLLASQAGLFEEWYLPAVGLSVVPALCPMIEGLYARYCNSMRPVCALRDFHAENIYWGDPLGLIDFQDAVIAHPAYDLVSALQDARRDVAPEVEAECLGFYIDSKQLDDAEFRAAYAVLGLQRNLRIMGIFTRLALRDGKKRYLALMPRVWGLVQRNLSHPALAEVAELLRDIPAPDEAFLTRMS